MQRQHILVTGGSGFIGTYLCRILKEQGNAVSVLDIRSPDNAVSGVKYIAGDILDPEALISAVAKADVVYHFAALVSVPLCQENPPASYDTNLFGTCNLLEVIRLENLKRKVPIRLLFASSSAVYGNSAQPGVAIAENRPLPEPASFYAAQKLNSEQAIRLYHGCFGVPVVIYRFFNVYGPGQDPNSPYSGVIALFSSAIAEGRELKLNGGGSQTRDFVSVHDVAEACARGAVIPEGDCAGQPINLGSGKGVTIEKLAHTMMKVAGRKVMLTPAPARVGDVLHSLSNISRAEKELGWKPKIKLEEGLAELHEFMRVSKAA